MTEHRPNEIKATEAEKRRQKKGGIDRRGTPTKAIVVSPDIRKKAVSAETETHVERTPAERLAEAVGLALAIDLDIVHSLVAPVPTIRPATLLGSGKVEEISGVVAATDAGLVIVDHPLTPIQQRNLEKAWNAKVLDRTALILEIFGRRAATKEGALQVELAHLNYQRGRLVRSWTHLERQRGGAGFLGGPGETQIEADRRILRDKIKRLENDLEQVRRTRTLHRSKRKKVPLPVVAFVGYTNAGKSTLFNRITGAEVLAKDMLFATLDPTLRRVKLPGGTDVILSDTVGFISDLPTHLVAAFRATLEEVQEADIVLHVHDASDPQVTAQASDVEQVLADLDIDANDKARVIDVWNKTDALDADTRGAIEARAENVDNHVAVSAITGEGIDTLLALMETKLAGAFVVRRLTAGPEQYADIAWLYENAIVDRRDDHDDGIVTLEVRVTPDTDTALTKRFAQTTP